MSMELVTINDVWRETLEHYQKASPQRIYPELLLATTREFFSAACGETTQLMCDECRHEYDWVVRINKDSEDESDMDLCIECITSMHNMLKQVPFQHPITAVIQSHLATQQKITDAVNERVTTSGDYDTVIMNQATLDYIRATVEPTGIAPHLFSLVVKAGVRIVLNPTIPTGTIIPLKLKE